MLNKLWSNSFMLKITILFLCLTLGSSAVYARAEKNNENDDSSLLIEDNNLAPLDNNEPSPITKNSAEEDVESKKLTGSEIDLSQFEYYEQAKISVDGSISARVARKAGQSFDSVIFSSNDAGMKLVELSNINYSNIEYSEWIDEERYGICAHINPSQEVYIVVDSIEAKVIDKFYGLGFFWSNNKERIYYVNSGSPDSDSSNDQIVDSLGHVYYDAGDEHTITSVMKASNDEKTFAFFVNHIENNIRELIIAEMNESRKLIPLSEKESPIGEILFMNDNKVKVIPFE